MIQDVGHQLQLYPLTYHELDYHSIVPSNITNNEINYVRCENKEIDPSKAYLITCL